MSAFSPMLSFISYDSVHKQWLVQRYLGEQHNRKSQPNPWLDIMWPYAACQAVERCRSRRRNRSCSCCYNSGLWRTRRVSCRRYKRRSEMRTIELWERVHWELWCRIRFQNADTTFTLVMFWDTCPSTSHRAIYLISMAIFPAATRWICGLVVDALEVVSKKATIQVHGSRNIYWAVRQAGRAVWRVISVCHFLCDVYDRAIAAA